MSSEKLRQSMSMKFELRKFFNSTFLPFKIVPARAASSLQTLMWRSPMVIIWSSCQNSLLTIEEHLLLPLNTKRLLVNFHTIKNPSFTSPSEHSLLESVEKQSELIPNWCS
ncbi:uncharacterized protein OGAPODRAFT_95381 [Ogataea polymorpha]|uniref:uncharacterized protein n=1 Tax=Ogataea polymorpha TaxID=460523 RepID=UPI0007F4C5FA|nr:uncharacterized protein OGAPODRAFT_95381 [Ogataea polymorpha]OBA14316.1 hypothetical protein OGAPODRAFT_95381 [Ogataea polymorpha]